MLVSGAMTLRAVLYLLIAALPALAQDPEPPSFLHETNVAVPMRDGTVLRADVLRPPSDGRFPTLVYRTPYGKNRALDTYEIFRKAVERGYAVVIQDVRGRYESDGDFTPYLNEGRDGFDTIEWAARQPWSNGLVGTFGLSYPGAVQWLAAMERPPHLKAMVPAMTFSTPRNFFYSGGVFDLSWIGWIWNSIAPDTRARKNLSGPKSAAEANAGWEQERRRMSFHLPLSTLPDLQDVAPYYYQWLQHPPNEAWWDWAELRGRYKRVDAAVLNLSGWHDEAYGPEGAITNYLGLTQARAGQSVDPKTAIIMGPWVHGVAATGTTRSGDREFGSTAAIDYDETVLTWMDHHLRGSPLTARAPVRLFLMGANRWLEFDRWPATKLMQLYLSNPDGERTGVLQSGQGVVKSASSQLLSDPRVPLEDPYASRRGAFDYRDLAKRQDVLVFDSEPLTQSVDVVGFIKAEIHISSDAPDTDLWVHVLDVAPDGSAFSLMSPGTNAVRASYNLGPQRKLLRPGKVYALRFENLVTATRFEKGHRIRILIGTSFMPHFSRNLHTGELENSASRMRTAKIRVHHDAQNPSRIELPVLAKESQ